MVFTAFNRSGSVEINIYVVIVVPYNATEQEQNQHFIDQYWQAIMYLFNTIQTNGDLDTINGTISTDGWDFETFSLMTELQQGAGW